MAVFHRQTAPVRLPQDFGLGLAVTTLLGGLVLVFLAAASHMDSAGPRAESRAPGGPDAYVDIQPSTAPAVLPQR